MSPEPPSRHAVLDSLVAVHRRSDGGVSVATLAGVIGGSEEVVAKRLHSLRALELAAYEGSGYRPTVTGEELVELGLDGDGGVGVDVVDEP